VVAWGGIAKFWRVTAFGDVIGISAKKRLALTSFFIFKE
jgi:hypothetical protein